MKNKTAHFGIALTLLLSFAACGGQEQTTAENQAEQVSTPQASDEQTEDLQPVSEVLHYAENEVPLKPMQLSDTRYMKEMVREEISQAYGETGEFIDPRRIIDMLKEQEEVQPAPTQPQPQPVEDQDSRPAPRSWRISYEVHNEAKALFEQGQYAQAAQRWRNLATDRRAFTLSIEVDCDPSMLKSGYAVLQTLELPIFILPEQVGDRDCFRLCAGVFTDESSAEEVISEVKKRVPDSWPFALAFSGSGS